MTRAEKIKLLVRLVARGEELCARVCAMDWNLEKAEEQIEKEYGVEK